MKTILAAVLLVTVASASTAAACDRFNRDYVSVNVGALPFFNVGFHVHSRPVPCPEVPFGPPRPQVVYVPAPQPQVVYVPQTQVYTPPPPPPPQVVYVPVAAPQPVSVAPPPPPPAPPAPVQRVTVVNNAPQEPKRDDDPARLALKYQPGANSSLALTNALTIGAPSLAHNVGLEVRLTNWFSFRSDWERRAESSSFDLLGAKLSVPTKYVSPYISGSFSATNADREPGKFSIGLVAATGIDFKIGKHFFLEAEARYRVAPDACCREVPQLTALVGAGVAFF